MSLNKSKGNMYTHVTHTWNPLGGECPHKCSYCSTNKLKQNPDYGETMRKKYSGELFIISRYMDDQFPEGSTIFVVSQNDLFADDVDIQHISKVLDKLAKHNCNYLLQTKNPGRLYGWLKYIPKNTIVSTTIETNRWLPDFMGNSPYPDDRAFWMSRIDRLKHLTIEPIMDFDLNIMVDLVKQCRIAQVNVGADTGGNKLPEPSKEKILALINRIEKFTTVKTKSNLKRLL